MWMSINVYFEKKTHFGALPQQILMIINNKFIKTNKLTEAGNKQ